ncbi:MAG: polysaccharide deacetylase family protein [Chitinophagales bacterium]
MPNQSLLIYSPRNSPRLQYTLQLIFKNLLGLSYEFTTDRPRFSAFGGAKLSYAKTPNGEAIFIYAEELLFESDIKLFPIPAGTFNEIKTIFHHPHTAALPFDPFAATFYLVSRYEEYLPFKTDKHGRFPAELSLSYKEGFHKVPVVNHYALLLKQLIISNYPDFIFPEKKYQFQLTYDIDMVFAFREKGVLRNVGGFLRSFIAFNFREIAFRMKVLTRLQQDPFDTFDYQQLLHEKYSLRPVYFFLLGDHSMYDKNIDWRKDAFRKVVKQIADKNETGMHASYDSNRFPEKIKIEKQRLEKMSGRNVFRNRQHFLKLQFPDTYQKLFAAGITEDYTIGYSSQTGFRAGIASSFYFYDLQKEISTKLHIHPFAAMDAAMFYNMKMSPDAALAQSKQLADEVKKVNGTFTFLAHNDLISNQGPWKGWQQNFEALISYCNAPIET